MTKKYKRETIKQMVEIIKEELEDLEDYDTEIIREYARVKLHKNIINAIFFKEEDNPNFTIEEMRKLDLSEVDFDSKDLSNKDYSYTNINFNPQKIKNKSLFYTNLAGTDMFGKDFTDIDIRGTNLTYSNANITLTTIRSINSDTILEGCHIFGKIDPIEEIIETFKIYKKSLQ